MTEQYKIAYSNQDALLGDFPDLGDNFLDLHGVFGGDEYIYIDADPAGPNCNALTAPAIGALRHR